MELMQLTQTVSVASDKYDADQMNVLMSVLCGEIAAVLDAFAATHGLDIRELAVWREDTAAIKARVHARNARETHARECGQ